MQSAAVDWNITRYRPKIINAETGATDGSAQDRAELEASTRAGKSTRITVQVVGWKMSDGKLWPLNALTNLRSPMLVADDVDLLISQVVFVVSESEGIVTELSLVKPGTYLLGRDKGKKKKKGKGKMPPIDWELEGY